ncbi:MAG: pseudouridine-5'-phosphate glycosidase [Phycisphaerales bacterium]|jgi:pseudouridine-5'-phosphate glycosidase|nr:pseudouridine-5'-phosphate glycosidase [Phycisphaerales bacterium]
MIPNLINRAEPRSVALETTLLLHGVPRAGAAELARSLQEIVRAHGASPTLIALVGGRAIVGLSDAELAELLSAASVPKANTANLGVLMHRGQHAATTVSTTMELAASAGVRVFATGGLGGVHRGCAEHFDVSSDLAALTRFPVAVVSSGVKSILDVVATREALETLGVPVVGFRTERFPAFYQRESAAGVDARFDGATDLAGFVRMELARSGRGVLIVNPVPPTHEIDAGKWRSWLDLAMERARAKGVTGRDLTPALLAAVHELSGGETLRANVELVKSNAALAAQIAARL